MSWKFPIHSSRIERLLVVDSVNRHGMVECHKSVFCSLFAVCIRLVSSLVYVKKVLIEIFAFGHCLNGVSVCATICFSRLTISRQCDERVLCVHRLLFVVVVVVLSFSLSFTLSWLNFERISPIISHLFGYSNWNRWEYIIHSLCLYQIAINLCAIGLNLLPLQWNCECWSYTINRHLFDV